MTPFHSFTRGAACVAALALLCGCATLTYEAEEWRLAVPPKGDAQAVVRYIGLATPSTKPATREQLAATIEDMANDPTPSSAYAPLRTITSRKVYLEGNRIVLEEAGTLRNPFTWFNQSGLNPATWWSAAPALVRKNDFIVMRDIESPRRVIATDGRVVDEDTYTSMLKSRLPVDITSDTKWQRRENQPPEDDVRVPQAELILWPRHVRSFYWKISGPAFGQPHQWLTREYTARVKPRIVAAPPPAPAPEPPVTVTPLPDEPVPSHPQPAAVRCPVPARPQPQPQPAPASSACPAPARAPARMPAAPPPVPSDAGLVPVGGLQPLDDDATIK